MNRWPVAEKMYLYSQAFPLLPLFKRARSPWSAPVSSPSRNAFCLAPRHFFHEVLGQAPGRGTHFPPFPLWVRPCLESVFVTWPEEGPCSAWRVVLQAGSSFSKALVGEHGGKMTDSGFVRVKGIY